MGTQFGIDLVFKAVGGDKIGRELKKVSVAARQVSTEVGTKVKGAFDRAGAAAKRFGDKVSQAMKKGTDSSRKFQKSLKGITGIFAQLAVAAAGIGSLRVGVGREQSAAQLTAIARSYEEIDRRWLLRHG